MPAVDFENLTRPFVQGGCSDDFSCGCFGLGIEDVIIHYKHLILII